MKNLKFLCVLLICSIITKAQSEGVLSDIKNLQTNSEMHIIEYFLEDEKINEDKRPINIDYTQPKFEHGKWEATTKSFSPQKSGIYRFYISAMRDSFGHGNNGNDIVLELHSNGKELASLWIGQTSNNTGRISNNLMTYLSLLTTDKLHVEIKSQSEKGGHAREIKFSLEYLGESN